MSTSSFKSIEEALLDLQRTLPRTLEKNAVNPFTSSKYVTLDALLETITPELAQRDVLLTQRPQTTVTGSLALETLLVHVPSDTLMVSTMPLDKLQKDDPQGQGSAITYGRRYAIMAMLGLVGDDDDDGNAAATKPKKKPAAAAKPGAKKKPAAAGDDSSPY